MTQVPSDRQERILSKMYEHLFGVNRDYAPGKFLVIARDLKEYLDHELDTLKRLGYVKIYEDDKGAHEDHWELTEAGYDLGRRRMWNLP